MLIAYREITSDLRFCARTKSYYGEVLTTHIDLVFIATNRKDAISAMQAALDTYLGPLRSVVGTAVAVPEA